MKEPLKCEQIMYNASGDLSAYVYSVAVSASNVADARNLAVGFGIQKASRHGSCLRVSTEFAS